VRIFSSERILIPELPPGGSDVLVTSHRFLRLLCRGKKQEQVRLLSVVNAFEAAAIALLNSRIA
jgi:hypothetical protein